MADFNNLYDYVTTTPGNTNKRVLREMLNGFVDDHINISFQPQKTLEELNSTLPNKSLFVCKDISNEINLIVFKQDGDEPDNFDFETSHFSVKSSISNPFSLDDPQAYSITTAEGYINGDDDNKVAFILFSTFITSSQTASSLSFLSDVQSENGFSFLQGEDSEDSRAIIFVIDDDMYIYVTANFTGNLMMKSESINTALEDLTLTQGWNKITSFDVESTHSYAENSPIDDINNDLSNISMTGDFFTKKVGSSEVNVPTIFEWKGQNFEEVLGYTFSQDGENINYSILCTANPSTFEIDSNNVLRNSTISL